MNFQDRPRRGTRVEDVEINFIPLIDVLLVILIFLLVTTTYSKFSELHIILPAAEGKPEPAQLKKLEVAVTAEGSIFVDQNPLGKADPTRIAEALKTVSAGVQQPIVIVHADAGTAHQSVIDVLEGCRRAGLGRITFATQTGQ